MGMKRAICLGAFILGAICIMLSLHGMQKTHEAKKNISTVAGDLDEAPINIIIGRVLQQKVGEYDRALIGLFIGGMALLIGGSGTLLWLRNR